jgi:cytochrome c556
VRLGQIVSHAGIIADLSETGADCESCWYTSGIE